MKIVSSATNEFVWVNKPKAARTKNSRKGWPRLRVINGLMVVFTEASCSLKPHQG